MHRIIRNSPPRRLVALAAALLLLVGTAVLSTSADVITLKDGTTIEGEVKKLGSSYQVKLPDGQFRLIPERDVESVTPGSGAAAPAAGGKPGANPKPPAATGKPAVAGAFSPAFEEIKKRTDRIDEPVRGVTLWEQHLARKDLSDGERAAVEKELAVWKKRYTEGAEKVKNKWMEGEELKKLKEETEKLVEEGRKLEETSGGQLAAVNKYQEAIRRYPNSFGAHFRLGYIELERSNGPGGNPHARKAKKSLEWALRLAPENPAILSNYGACLFALGEPQKGVDYLWRAVKKGETDLTVGNLLYVLDSMPRRFYDSSAKMRDIYNEAAVLRGKYQGKGLLYIGDPNHGLEVADVGTDDGKKGPPGLQGNGSGFFITPDGYLLTNKHVAETEENQYYRIRLSDKDKDGNYVEYLAKFIAADSTFDVALLKVELPEGKTVPYLDVLGNDFPPVAAQVMVLGYPATGLTGNDGMIMQVDIGTIKSNNPGHEYEVWFDLSTTHGNSGGPIVDRNGDVVGILSAGSTVYNVTYVLGIGPKQIREFFARIGEKAPDLSTLARADDTPFDGEKLAAKCKDATLLVLIFRGSLDAGGDSAGETPATDGSGKGGSAAAGAGEPE